MKRVTITNVAQMAGVSKSTVSHVINQTRFVNDETRQRVLESIETLGYRPSGIARSLVSQRSMTAGLLISDVANPFYHEVILGVEEVAFNYDYSIFLGNTSYDLERGMKLVQSLIDRSVDGVLFMTSSMTMEMVQAVVDNQVRAVVLDWGVAQVDDLAATITINFHEGISEAIEYLVDLGHRQIGYVGGPMSFWTSWVRRDAFNAALRMSSLDPQDVFITEGDLRIDGGYEVFHDLMQARPRPTAVLAANDLTALGLLWAANNYGLRVPEDLSIIGLDDIHLASKVTPALTTISLPRFEIGRIAMQVLLAMIKDPTVEIKRQEVSTHLVVRQSTACRT